MTLAGMTLGILLAFSGAPPGSEAAAAETRAMAQDLAWSPDGGQIYFSAMRVKPDYSDYAPSKWAVYRYDLASRELRRVVPSALFVAVDPAGQRLAVGKLVDGNQDIYLVDASGKEISRLTTDPADDLAATWAPDGKRIAFNSRRDGKPEIYRIQVDGTDLRRLTHGDGASAYNPSWSPDGSLIAYYLEKGDHRDQIYVMRPDGSGAANLTGDDGNNVFPGWTPDGRVIYTRGAQDRPGRTFTVRPDGKEKQALLAIESSYARYSPDGSKIACIPEEGDSIRLLAADGKLLETIPLDGVE
jgi:TolB protein